MATSDYATLIAMFLNDAKEDMEDQWFWTVNETSIDTTLSDGTRTYDLTSTTDRSFMIRHENDRVPMAYDITASENNQLQDISLKELNNTRDSFRGTIPKIAAPMRFAVTPDSDGRGWTLTLEQAPDGARTWRTYWYIPQAELALDGTADSTNIVLPERPLFLRTLYYALNERGEEMGEPGGVAETRADNALDAALELDTQTNRKTETKDMTNLEFLRNGIVSGWAHS